MSSRIASSHTFVTSLSLPSFTALSFVDIQELTNDNIVEVNGEKWILSKRHKTKVAFQVKLLDIPLQIVERYRPMQKDNRIFPGLNLLVYLQTVETDDKGMWHNQVNIISLQVVMASQH